MAKKKQVNSTLTPTPKPKANIFQNQSSSRVSKITDESKTSKKHSDD
jgi:hypothetical protein